MRKKRGQEWKISLSNSVDFKFNNANSNSFPPLPSRFLFHSFFRFLFLSPFISSGSSSPPLQLPSLLVSLICYAVLEFSTPMNFRGVVNRLLWRNFLTFDNKIIWKFFFAVCSLTRNFARFFFSCTFSFCHSIFDVSVIKRCHRETRTNYQIVWMAREECTCRHRENQNILTRQLAKTNRFCVSNDFFHRLSLSGSI